MLKVRRKRGEYPSTQLGLLTLRGDERASSYGSMERGCTFGRRRVAFRRECGVFWGPVRGLDGLLSDRSSEQ